MVKTLLGCLLLAIPATSPLVARVTIGPATIALEETTFAAVAKQLGAAQIIHTGRCRRKQGAGVQCDERPAAGDLLSRER